MTLRRSRKRSPGRRRPREDRYDEYQEFDEDLDELDETPRSRRPTRRARSGAKSKGGRRLDFDAVNAEADRDAGRARGRARAPKEPVDRGRRRERRRRRPLAELCTPAFAYASMLPQRGEDPQPDPLPFREGVVSALQRIPDQASENGIDRQDAEEAAYAVAAFVDEQVSRSEWTARDAWEPLNVALNDDAEAGVNFWKRLARLRDDQTEVQRIFLYCIALGFKGKFATLDARAQAQEIGRHKKELLARVQDRPLEDEDKLFPEAYEESDALEDEVERPPRWWTFTSLGIVVACVIAYLLMYWWAGELPAKAIEAVKNLEPGG